MDQIRVFGDSIEKGGWIITSWYYYILLLLIYIIIFSWYHWYKPLNYQDWFIIMCKTQETYKKNSKIVSTFPHIDKKSTFDGRSTMFEILQRVMCETYTQLKELPCW